MSGEFDPDRDGPIDLGSVSGRRRSDAATAAECLGCFVLVVVLSAVGFAAMGLVARACWWCLLLGWNLIP